MAASGPWPASRRVAVAVSGGADSLCLALLARHWGNPSAFIVDHGLRPGSLQEARQAAAQLEAFGVPSRILTVRDLRHGPGLAARARNARYEALAAAMQEERLVDLLVGHHAGDQAETILMRKHAKSGQAGLAGMAAITHTASLRIVRPLLAADPALLRRSLRQAGLAWIEDPSNCDMKAQRPRLRETLKADPALATSLLATAGAAAIARAERDSQVATILAQRCTIFPEGHALLAPGPVAPDALAALLRTLAGAAYPANAGALTRMANRPAPGTLAGIRFLASGRLGPGLLLVREAAAMQPEIAAGNGKVWDRRFRLQCECEVQPGTTMGALAADAPRFRRLTQLPSAILQTLPAIRRDGAIVAIPHIGYFNDWTLQFWQVTLSPPVPLSGAPFARMQPDG